MTSEILIEKSRTRCLKINRNLARIGCTLHSAQSQKEQLPLLLNFVQKENKSNIWLLQPTNLPKIFKGKFSQDFFSLSMHLP